MTADGVTQTDPNALFGESITYYETSPLGTTAQYNGNISGLTWRNKIEASGKPGVTTGGQGYKLTYSTADRLTQTAYYTQSGSSFTQNTSGAFTENITGGYDEMGNIFGLQHKDKNGSLINNIEYTYGTLGNRVTSVSDAGSQSVTGTFTYDGNGNMISDSHKNIAITYNYLDLPDTVKQGMSKLVFTYDAAGNKLYKQLINGSTVVSQRHYIEDTEVTATSSIATDGKVESFGMAEGRIVNTGAGGYKYEYFLQDHLYNNRVSFRIKSDGTADLSQVQNYYPFGEDMGDSTMNYSTAPNNLFKYSDKELQTELNLNTYDFGARHYNPQLARWMSMDPLALESEELSPYNYVEDNPFNLMDPDGMQASGSMGGWLKNVTIYSGGAAGAGGGGGIPGGGGNYPTGWALGIGEGIHALKLGADALKTFDIRNTVVSKQDWTSMPKMQNPNLYIPGQQGTISQWQPGITDRFRASNFINRTIYDATDEALITVHSVFWPVGEVRHIDGRIATPREIQGAFVSNAITIVTLGDATELKAAAEDVATKELPMQTHHFATNKHSFYTPEMEKIANKFGLKLDEAWNRAKLPHSGRHPNEYHEFVWEAMRKAESEAGSSQAQFIKLFDKYIIQPVKANPGMLRKSGW